MPEQKELSLDAGLQATNGSATARLMAAINRALLDYGPKRVVLIDELDMKSESQLSEALRDKGKNFALRWLPGVIRYDRDNLIITEIAGWRSLRVLPKKAVSDAAYRRAMERVLERHNGAGEALRAEAMAIAELEVEP